MSSDCLRSGFFSKEGGSIKTWKTRYFVLTRDALSYYTKEDKKMLKGTISKATVTGIRKGTHPKKPNVLFMDAKDSKQRNRSYAFSFNTVAEREAWEAALSEWTSIPVGGGSSSGQHSGRGTSSGSVIPPPPSSPPPLENIRDEKLTEQYKRALSDGETERALELRDELTRRGLPVPTDSQEHQSSASSSAPSADNRDGPKELVVLDRHTVSPDSDVFRVSDPHGMIKLGPGDHLLIQHNLYVNKDGKCISIVEPYSPISAGVKYFDLLIKRYPESNPDGISSRYCHQWTPGSKVHIAGQLHRFDPETNVGKPVTFIAMGTGITPIFSLINDLLPRTDKPVQLIFGNRTEDDILLCGNLAKLQDTFPHFKVHFVLSRPPAAWEQLSGRINKDLLGPLVGEAASSTRFVICGSKTFGADIKSDVLALGAKEDAVFVF